MSQNLTKNRENVSRLRWYWKGGFAAAKRNLAAAGICILGNKQEIATRKKKSEERSLLTSRELRRKKRVTKYDAAVLAD